ncbi:SH3 domain-containing protein [Chryseobacterium tructae]|uniref:SH3 domain-containing protein n=1 Tax=Chryseobacterium tructae TaxID=1037380 RepID=A0ABV7Y458_9FLAO|nr:SH3 domain-containing protein [Chryseobacterium tructae]MDN3694174.1 SH3 domain-containing protein [Chryseobacterium tructae]
MKPILSILLFLISISYLSQNKKNYEAKIHVLQQSFSNRKEKDFLDSFPKDFISFTSIFGWDDDLDKAEPLYHDSNAYIEYWFSLLQKPQYKHHEVSIVTISKNGKWEADAVNYFKIKSIEYIKINKKFSLINALSKKDAEQVLPFLLDSPHPKFDSLLIYNLTPEKQKIAKEFLSKNAYDKSYYIQDTDGYTNLRKGKSTTSQTLQKINTGETIEVLDQNGNWWLVISKEGKKGYVHKSRIQSR